MKSLWLISLLAVLQVATPGPLCAQYTPARLKTLDSALNVLHQQASFNGVVLVAEKG
ncbi:MAG: serine hydrolase, partial [Bacteroidetes bacterium]